MDGGCSSQSAQIERERRAPSTSTDARGTCHEQKDARDVHQRLFDQRLARMGLPHSALTLPKGETGLFSEWPIGSLLL